MKKVALFGGSFDPIHLGHVDVIRSILETEYYDALWVIPCRLSPGKSTPTLDPNSRLTMLTDVCTVWDSVTVLDLELMSEGPSYTITTVETLQAQHPETQFELWMGMDQFEKLETWHRAEDLVQLIGINVFDRDSTRNQAQIEAMHRGVLMFLVLRYHSVNARPVSSSEIRAALNAGDSVQGLVPRQTLRYLRTAFPQCRMPYVTGIAGRAGSGKSTYAKKISDEKDVVLIELDKLGHEVLEREDIQAQLMQQFGPDIKTDTGEINRSKLGAIVFNDPEKLAQLNRLVHPLIKAACLETIKDASTDVIIEGALIEEIGLLDYCDRYIVMDVPDMVAIARNKRHIKPILIQQRSRQEFIKNADQVIST